MAIIFIIALFLIVFVNSIILSTKQRNLVERVKELQEEKDKLKEKQK